MKENSSPKHQALIICNLTPDSFSDGGVWNHPQRLRDKIFQELKMGVRCFDFGAESTSPRANPITKAIEWQRFEEIFLPLLTDQTLSFPPETLFSFDTLSPNIFFELYRRVKERFPWMKIVWNDVAGQWSGEVEAVLKECPEAIYSYMHSFQKSGRDHFSPRGELFAGDISSLCQQMEEEFMEIAKHQFLRNRLIFDPGFSFGKSPDLTRQLIQQTAFLISNLKKKNVTVPWTLSISRKTCLRDQVLEKTYEGGVEMAERFHFFWLVQWMRELQETAIFYRLHNAQIFQEAEIFGRWFR